MKQILISLAVVVTAMMANAQSEGNGVYLTQTDFENKKLSYSTNDRSAVNKIRFNEILGKPYLTIRHNGEKIILFKDDIFAYKKKGNIVRTSEFVSYNFLEKGVIWIYFKDMNVAQGKGMKREKKYYYSVSGKGRIIPLTIYNLKKSFPGKYTFHNFLDAQFRGDSELSLYDSFQKKFKVNHLLETTIFGTADAIP